MAVLSTAVLVSSRTAIKSAVCTCSIGFFNQLSSLPAGFVEALVHIRHPQVSICSWKQRYTLYTEMHVVLNLLAQVAILILLAAGLLSHPVLILSLGIMRRDTNPNYW